MQADFPLVGAPGRQWFGPDDDDDDDDEDDVRRSGGDIDPEVDEGISDEEDDDEDDTLWALT